MFENGPFLAAAFLCNLVIEGKDGTLSAIRIVDRWIHIQQGADAPKEMPPVPMTLTLLLSFKAGAARGSSTITIRREGPSGPTAPETLSFPVLFEGEDRGVNIVARLGLLAEQEGLYWFDVFVDDTRVTRVPLRVVYQRVALGPA